MSTSKPVSRSCRRSRPAAIERKLSALRSEIERSRASLTRAVRREMKSLAAVLTWSVETLAAKSDLERLREEIRELRRPR